MSDQMAISYQQAGDAVMQLCAGVTCDVSDVWPATQYMYPYPGN